ncbi:DUF3631 domain-containing protein [Paucibacter sediminis]|uniref:DUF3631 domain-containing protein n=1 Tax=Paucibacter sediminis TaxID=3019553 RepID=A0AA95SNT0_9BURK|nr:DUF3631 domain-containing protein [Paucibacter sp. S2-9]WIT12907.1 DUF3631 domain-containing protein [Paucibacter sp. S2-9]
MEYDKVRRDEAKKLRVQLKTLDDMVKTARASSGPASRLPFTENEPAEEPVQPAKLLDDIAALIKKYVILEPEQADAAALWLAHTHLIDVADVSPIAIINAPERACAKTLFQTILGRLAYRPLFASNASMSALFRSIELWGATLLIDEADTFFRDNSDLHGMVNAGYKRGGFVLRSEVTTESIEPKMFSVYGAKSIAGIALEKHLPDATMSRGIVFGMRRKLAHEKVERFRHADDEVFNRLSSQLARFALDYAHQVRMARPTLPEQMSDRAQDNWEPLLAIAECAGDAWVQRATVAAIKMSVASESQASTGNDLLADIKEVLSKWSKPTIKTADLISMLIADDDMGWCTYNRGKPLTPRQLAKLLDAYSIKPKTVRQPKTPLEPNGSTPKGYDVGDFNDAFTRYLKADVPNACPEPQASTSPPTCLTDVAATEQQVEARRDGEPDLIRATAALLDPAPPKSPTSLVDADF